MTRHLKSEPRSFKPGVGARRRGRRAAALVVAAAAGISVGGCPTAAVVGFAIAARTFAFVLESTGVLEARAGGDPVRKAGVVALPFEGPASDRPAGAALRLDAGSVRALPLDDTSKPREAAQGINGSADVRVFIDGASATNPCNSGVEVGTFQLSFADGVVAVTNPSLPLPAAALDDAISGTFTICIEVTVTVDVMLVIEEMSVEFGDVEGDAPAGDDPGADEPGDDPDSDPGTDPGNDPGNDAGNDPGADPGNDPGNDPDPGNDAGNDSGNDPGSDPGSGFTGATILHRGTEQLIAGADVDGTISFAYDEDYSADDVLYDLTNRSFALSGTGTRVWLRLWARWIPEGEQRTQLWSMNTDGSGAMRSSLPADFLGSGLHLVTNEDGTYCFANNTSESLLYRARNGEPAVAIYDYEGVFDFRDNFAVSDDASYAVIGNLGSPGQPSVHLLNLLNPPLAPVTLLDRDALAIDSVRPRKLAFMDLAGDAPAYIFRPNYDSSSLDPRTQDAVFVGQGLSGASRETIAQTGFRDSPYDLNITDDGTTIAYTLPGEGLNGVNMGVVESLADGSQWTFSDGRSTIGYVVLSDNGNRVYYRSDRSFGNGNGILQDVGTERRWPAGTQVFGGTHWTAVQLSDDGQTLCSPIGEGLYCLKDNASPPANLPDIEGVSYRLNDDCTLTLRATIRAPRGIARVFVNPHMNGVDPTLQVEGAENPFYAIRNGGGVNQSTRLTELEDDPGVWEYTFGLKNDVNQCAEQFLTSDFLLRLIVVDETETVTVFQDFAVR